MISVVFAILFFCLAIATAVYGGRFGNDYNGFRDLDSDLAAVAVSFHIFCVCVCAFACVCVCVRPFACVCICMCV